MPAQILQITSVASLDGQQVLNRWHFVDAAGTGDPTSNLAAFKTNVIDVYKNDAHNTMVWSELIYRVITDPLSAQASYAVGFPVAGTQGGLPAASFVANSVKWLFGPTVILTPEVPQRRIRRGGKRLGGYPQTQFSGDSIVPAGIAAVANILDGYLGMSDGGWLPCIAGLPKQPLKGTDPDDPALQVPNKYALIHGYVVNPHAGSQVSRKFGHGR